MTPLLTCKQFLHDLNDYLEDVLDPATREELQRHVNECPNCWVVCDTTRRTLKVYKGMEAQALPSEVHSRLMEALQKKMAERCGKHPTTGN
jgi:anti-sigma factor RsiW